MRRAVLVIILIGLAGLAGVRWLHPRVRALAVLADLSERDVPLRRWLPVTLANVSTRDVEIPTRHGLVAARLYLPDGRSRRTWLVVPGIHGGGVDEPRLVRLTTRLAGEGDTVLSLPLPDLRMFRVVGRSTDQIEDAALWLLGDAALAPHGTVSLAGISFGGGLTMVAAGRPSMADTVDRVVSFGGYGDLPRVIDYLCTGRLPDGTSQPAHDYGLAILLLGTLPHLVPPGQAAPLDAAVRAFLDASMAAGRNDPQAQALFADARRMATTLPEPAFGIMQDVLTRNVARLGPLVQPYADTGGGDPALSPERSPIPRAPVFLIHGAVDTVIPQSETQHLADHLRARGHTRVSSLLSPAISHADPTRDVSALDVWRLVSFWAALTRTP